MNKRRSEELDIDVRFLLANERTLLAWIRTALAIEAGGIALAQIHQHYRYLGIIVLLLGAAVAVLGYSRFRAADKAIRRGELPHAGHGPIIQVVAVIVLAILLAIAQLTILK